MSAIRVILNNSVNAVISNYDELSFDFANDNFQPVQEETFFPEFIKSNDNRDGVAFINDWIDSFTILRKIPIRIEHEFTGLTIFEGELDLANSANQFDDERGLYKVRAFSDNTNFFELAEDFNLRCLDWNESEFDYVAYIIDFTPDFMTAAVLALSVYTMTKEVVLLVKEGLQVAAYGLVGGLIQLGIIVLYISLTITAIVFLLKEISDYLFQKPKLYRSINIPYLLDKACAELGYTFNSSIFTGDYARLQYMAATNKPGVNQGRIPRNNPTPDRTLLQFMEDIGKMFNAKLRVTNGVVFYDSFNNLFSNPTPYVIPELKRNGTYSYAFDELDSNLTIKYQTDFSDLNIVNNYVSVEFGLVNATFADTVLTKKTIVDLPFCIAKRKDATKRWEVIFNTIYDALSGSKLQGANGKIGSRTGFMSLWNDSTSLDRVFIRDVNRKFLIDKNNNATLAALTLYNNFYEQTNPINFQFKKWRGSDDRPLCNLADAIALFQNPVCRDWEGNLAIMTKNTREARGAYHSMEFKTRLSATDKAYIPPSQWTVMISTSENDDELDCN